MRQSIDLVGYPHGQPIPVASKRGPLFMSGGIAGVNRVDTSVPDDAVEQCKLMFENVGAALEQAGGTFDHVVKMTFYVKTREAKSAINDEWIKAFPDENTRPARHTRTYEHLPANVVLQCDVTAWVD